jgi:exonuclease SbcD
MTLTIAHFSDLHASERTAEKARHSLKFCVDHINFNKCDLAVFSGDLWHGPVGIAEASPVHWVMEELHRLTCPLLIVYGTPSHDNKGSLKILPWLQRWFTQISDTPETVLFYGPDSKGHRGRTFATIEDYTEPGRDDGSPDAVIFTLPAPTKANLLAEVPGLAGLGIEETNQVIAEELRKIFLGFAAIGREFDCPKILVGHITVAGSELSTGQTMPGGDIQIGKGDLELAGADYYALGHIHKPQAVSEKVHYAGSMYPLNWGEAEQKSFNIVAFQDGRLDVGRIPLPAPPMVDIQASYNLETGGYNFVAQETKGAEVRFRVQYPQDEDWVISEKQIDEMFPNALSVKVEKLPVPQERIRSKGISKAVTLRDKVRAFAEASGEEPSAGVLAKADTLEIAERRGE